MDDRVATAEKAALLTDEAAQVTTGQTLRPLGWTFRILFALASLVTGLCNVTIKQLLLPAQVSILTPNNQVATFALIASVGAFAGVVMAPLAGALSDRTVSRWGRRRPWIVGGTVLAVLGLILMARATSVLTLLIGEIVVQIAVDTIMSAITAIIPDQVPTGQRAVASAFVGMSPIVGGLVGLLLMARFVDATKNPQQGYYILALASCVLVALFLIVLREKPLTRESVAPFNFSRFLAHFWVSPKKYPDFAYTWLSRCLIFLGYTIFISYLFFYLRDTIHFAGPDKGVALFQVIATGILIIAAIVGGIIADRVQRLKPFVIGGALLMALALLIIAFVPLWPVMIVAAVILGLGFGVYLSVDLALAVRVLPDVKSSGKDLGLINTAIFIPLIFSPLIGVLVLNTFHGTYAALFTVAALSFVAAGALIVFIKGVR